MSSSMFPRNCQAIREARANGMKPAGPVLVMFAKQFPTVANDAVVYVDNGCSYRWDWLRGLNIVVLVDKATQLGMTLDDINEQAPAQLDVVDVERGLGWLVTVTRPRLASVRWPAAWVADWLGDGSWHRELESIKKDSANVIEIARAEHERRFACS